MLFTKILLYKYLIEWFQQKILSGESKNLAVDSWFDSS